MAGVSTKPRDGIAQFLGTVSLGLGTPQITAPWLLNRAIGVRDDGTARAWQVVVGMREIAAGVGIFSTRRPAEWLWARVAGDAMDLALLTVALRNRSEHPARVVGAICAVAGVAVADVTAARRHSGAPKRIRVEAVTVRSPREEVYRRWKGRAADGMQVVEDRPNELIRWSSENGGGAGTVQFAPAPGSRGTEIRYSGDWSRMRASDELRRFKQLVETGEIVRSDGSPEGQNATRLLDQRPASPLPEGSSR